MPSLQEQSKQANLTKANYFVVFGSMHKPKEKEKMKSKKVELAVTHFLLGYLAKMGSTKDRLCRNTPNVVGSAGSETASPFM